MALRYPQVERLFCPLVLVSCQAYNCQSDLEEVSVHYLQAAGGAQGLPLQGGHSGEGGRIEGGRRVGVLLKKIIRPRGTLQEHLTM